MLVNCVKLHVSQLTHFWRDAASRIPTFYGRGSMLPVHGRVLCTPGLSLVLYALYTCPITFITLCALDGPDTILGPTYI